MTAVDVVKRAVSVLLTLAVVGVVAIFVVQAAPGVVGAEESYVVLSGSMQPTISPGDAVVLRSVDPEDVAAGDVITFRRGGESEPVTHRVVAVEERADGRVFRTKGDGNEDVDPSPVPASNLVGRVWFVLPWVGHVVLFANTTLGTLTLVALPLVAFAMSELYDLAREGRREAREPDAPVTDAEDGLLADVADERSADSPADDGSADANPDTDAAPARDAAPDSVPDSNSAQHSDANSAPARRTPPAGDAEDAFQVTTTDLRLSTAGFGALAAYSGFVAYRDPGAVSVAVFAAAAVVLAFVAVVYLFGASEPAPARASVTDGGRDAGAAQSAPEPTSTATHGGEDRGE